MRWQTLRVAVATIAAIGFGSNVAGRPAPDSKSADESARNAGRLRKPGFVFVELTCRSIADHVAFFGGVGGFEIARKESNFAILLSARGEVLLNEVGGEGKPVRHQGPRVEIGIVVDDLDKALAHAKKQKGWTIEPGILRQPWGVRDFRVFAPEGYYLRITEGPK